ncbi:uncharacterized protein LOC106869789 [Octopus bimaculoides]|uniref:Uncharacterized protein n=1 Tax=Octopus bimaculoides TaxID=37653 RepID=A0A0L8HM89_OCTBM|nr:uncharacterized protein LOC106869789 [Octopus bimaculoides]XP_052832305.1 uncharacterized protein LOC106869789 [Octopus bimaculoides]XP_052832306.1 uncharacterized protein LOC106869789 [Octopus bimaculoides]|eukprot:XP_014771135.1 PREDICTED: uncharacterized protein LOC106869789 [Octopus bimaculoides]
MSSCKEESESCLSLCASNGHEDAEQFDRISSSQTHAVSSTTCGEVAIHPNKSKSPKMSPSSSSSSSDAAVLQRTTVADMTKSKDFETFHLAPSKKADSKYYKEESAETTKEKSRSSSKKANKESGKLYPGKESVKW